MRERAPMRRAEISISAIRANLDRVRAVSGTDTIIAVLKSNAYGHGMIPVAEAVAAGGAAIIGVADIDEALSLREGGITIPVLCWLHGSDPDFRAAYAADIELGISTLAQLDLLAEEVRAGDRGGAPGTIHLKIDTGLSRNGLAERDWDRVFARAAELEQAGLIRVRGIFSHLANTNHEADLAQAAVFDDGVARLAAAGIDPELKHLASTAAAFRSPHLHYSAVRVGIGLYGLSPYRGVSSAELGLTPAMTLRTEIVHLREVPAGTGVSYGHTYVTDRPTTLALVAMGYADGMPRAVNGTDVTVQIRGERYPIVGRIGMDQILVDLGAQGVDIEVGECATMFGDPATGAPAVEEWSEAMDTINYEIVVGIGPRVKRLLVNE